MVALLAKINYKLFKFANEMSRIYCFLGLGVFLPTGVRIPISNKDKKARRARKSAAFYFLVSLHIHDNNQRCGSRTEQWSGHLFRLLFFNQQFLRFLGNIDHLSNFCNLGLVLVGWLARLVLVGV
jgi:hypothetical protein